MPSRAKGDEEGRQQDYNEAIFGSDTNPRNERLKD